MFRLVEICGGPNNVENDLSILLDVVQVIDNRGNVILQIAVIHEPGLNANA